MARGTARRGRELDFQHRFLLAAVAAVSLLFGWMIRDFLLTLLLAALATGLAAPLHGWTTARLRGRKTLASAVVVAGTLVLVVGPLTGLFGLVVSQAVEVGEAVGPWIKGQVEQPDSIARLGEWIPFFDRIEPLFPGREQLVASAGEAVRTGSAMLVNGLAAAGRVTARFFLQLFIFLFAMFFFLTNGREILERILHYTPLDTEDERAVLDRFLSVTRATLKGSLMIGGIQGLLTGLAFWGAGIQGAAFWGTVTVVLSVIPGVGAPIVWIPAAVWLFATGEVASGSIFSAWCALVVGGIDNLLRPRLVGSDAKMSDLMILLSTLGGISLFGMSGFVIGPIVAAVFVTIWELYGRRFADLLPPVGDA